jgi:glycosyltransferase involved in cell wall biosynthesis
MDLWKYPIAAVIPAYRVEKDIESVLCGLPPGLKHIIVVDDASPDSTADLIAASAKKDQRVVLIRHPQNAGVAARRSQASERLELGA